jgi:hypothetical protein
MKATIPGITVKNRLFASSISNKSSCIRQLAFRIQERGECAVIFDPAGEFIRQFYNEKRHDVVLNPLDERMPYWNPAEEVDDEAEALTLATSFYQPDKIPNQFFVESPQKIFAYLISREPKPTPEDLIDGWLARTRSKHGLKTRSTRFSSIGRRAHSASAS